MLTDILFNESERDIELEITQGGLNTPLEIIFEGMVVNELKLEQQKTFLVIRPK